MDLNYLLNDFKIYLIGSKLVFFNYSPYGISPAFQELKNTLNMTFHWGTGYSYPPLLAYLLIPFSLLPKYLSYLFWIILCLCSIFYLYQKVAKSTPQKIYLLTYAPLVISLLLGQINLILLPFFYYYFSKSSHSAIIFPSLIKNYPGGLLLFDFFKHPSFDKIKFAVLLFILYFLPNPSLSLNYLTHILPTLQSEFTNYPHLQSFPVLLFRLGISGPTSYFILAIFFIIGLYLYFKSPKNIDKLFLFIFLSLFAGQNSFQNYLPAVFVGLYYLQYLRLLGSTTRIVFLLTTFYTNFLAYFVQAMIPQTTNNLTQTILLNSGTIIFVVQALNLYFGAFSKSQPRLGSIHDTPPQG